MIHGHRYRPNECVLPCVLALLLLQLTSITLISGFSISGLRSATIATSSSSLYAFPKYSNRSSGNSRKNKSQQNYKHTDDDNDSFTIDGNAAPSTFNTRNRRSRSGSSDSNNGYINHRIQTSNRNHDSNNDNNNRNNNDRWRQHKRRRRPTKLNANELFTLESTAPPLVQTDITNKQVVSPTILLQNDLECHPSICGPLQVTYTNDAKTIERWLCDNVRPVNKGDRYSYVGFDVESVVSWRRHAKQSFSNGPATIQISTPSSSLVIHLTSRHTPNHHYHSTPTTCACKPLQAFLSDPSILKVGAGIDGDMLELYRYNPSLLARSRFDIGGIGSTSRYRRVGLQNLVRAAVGVELAKSRPPR